MQWALCLLPLHVIHGAQLSVNGVVWVKSGHQHNIGTLIKVACALGVEDNME